MTLLIEPLSSSTRAKSIGVAQGGLGEGGGDGGGGGVEGGEGGEGDGGDGGTAPPPQAQHIVLEEKSLTSSPPHQSG